MFIRPRRNMQPFTLLKPDREDHCQVVKNHIEQFEQQQRDSNKPKHKSINHEDKQGKKKQKILTGSGVPIKLVDYNSF
jgi:hypothetical protein